MSAKAFMVIGILAYLMVFGGGFVVVFASFYGFIPVVIGFIIIHRLIYHSIENMHR